MTARRIGWLVLLLAAFAVHCSDEGDNESTGTSSAMDPTTTTGVGFGGDDAGGAPGTGGGVLGAGGAGGGGGGGCNGCGAFISACFDSGCPNYQTLCAGSLDLLLAVGGCLCQANVCLDACMATCEQGDMDGACLSCQQTQARVACATEYDVCLADG
jgi:hypothetical protein